MKKNESMSKKIRKKKRIEKNKSKEEKSFLFYVSVSQSTEQEKLLKLVE